VAVALEFKTQRAPEHAFIGTIPVDSQPEAICKTSSDTLPSDGQQPRDDGRGRCSCRSNPRRSAHERLRDADNALLAAQSGTGGLPGIGIAQQWQNRVVIRGARNLDAAPLSRRALVKPASTPRQQLSLALITNVWSSWCIHGHCDQLRYLGLLQENSSNHASLRKHLQVGEIAIGEIFSIFPGALVRALLLPKFL